MGDSSFERDILGTRRNGKDAFSPSHASTDPLHGMSEDDLKIIVANARQRTLEQMKKAARQRLDGSVQTQSSVEIVAQSQLPTPIKSDIENSEGVKYITTASEGLKRLDQNVGNKVDSRLWSSEQYRGFPLSSSQKEMHNICIKNRKTVEVDSKFVTVNKRLKTSDNDADRSLEGFERTGGVRKCISPNLPIITGNGNRTFADQQRSLEDRNGQFGFRSNEKDLRQPKESDGNRNLLPLPTDEFVANKDSDDMDCGSDVDESDESFTQALDKLEPQRSITDLIEMLSGDKPADDRKRELELVDSVSHQPDNDSQNISEFIDAISTEPDLGSENISAFIDRISRRSDDQPEEDVSEIIDAISCEPDDNPRGILDLIESISSRGPHDFHIGSTSHTALERRKFY